MRKNIMDFRLNDRFTKHFVIEEINLTDNEVVSGENVKRGLDNNIDNFYGLCHTNPLTRRQTLYFLQKTDDDTYRIIVHKGIWFYIYLIEDEKTFFNKLNFMVLEMNKPDLLKEELNRLKECGHNGLFSITLDEDDKPSVIFMIMCKKGK